MDIKLDQILLHQITRRSINSAGARYTPAIVKDAPNIQIMELLYAIKGLSTGESINDIIQDIVLVINKSIKYSTIIKNIGLNTDLQLDNICTHLNKLKNCSPNKTKDLIVSVTKVINDSLDTARNYLNKVNQEPIGKKTNEIESYRSDIFRIMGALDKAQDFLQSPTCALLNNNQLMILGEWGSGKTHFLCDVSERYMQSDKLVILFLAKDLKSGCPLDWITQQAKCSLEQFLITLNEHGQRIKSRALLIIDGINEGDRNKWREAIQKLSLMISKYTYIGLIVSCRSNFEEFIFTKEQMNDWIQIKHIGFEGNEFDAQKEFFTFHNIPLPDVPLLSEEFSRPLTLKLICESLTDLSNKKKKNGINGIASGQKAMTKILEDYIKDRGKEVENKYNLPDLYCWNLLKGKDNKIPCIASIMTDQLQDYITKTQAIEIIRIHITNSKLRKIDPKDILISLINAGVLVEDIKWEMQNDEPKSTVIIRLPYQRFSDHLIARYLLKRYLHIDKTKPEECIKRSLHQSTPLGSIFKPSFIWSNQYSMPGLAEAIIIEFPERVKDVLPNDKRELFFYLPKSSQLLENYIGIFISGLFWRQSSSFCKQTDWVINEGLYRGHLNDSRKLLDTLCAIVTKPDQYYSSLTLYKFLYNFPMNERDHFWSEFLRNREAHQTIEKLIHWLETKNIDNLKHKNSLSLIQLLSLLLTTTDRHLRDRVTKCLVKLGKHNPQHIFTHTIETLSFNDPYVPERMLAAAYGVTMAKWALRESHFINELKIFAQQLVIKIFLPNSPFGTHHCLTRDYALGVINLARKISPYCIANKNIKFLSPPHINIKNPFPSYSNIEAENTDEAKHAIHSDFENYTLGRLVDNRNNYDFKNKTYIKIKKQIEWRILNLGYSQKLFEQIDKEIITYNDLRSIKTNKGTAIDRYGKKYSLIAYFEMYGLRESQHLISKSNNERTSDCDIDPSFPEPPPLWEPLLPDVFSKKFKNPIDWLASNVKPDYKNLIKVDSINGIEGPWILLDGHIRQEEPKNERNLLAEIRGLMIPKNNIHNFQEKYFSGQYKKEHTSPSYLNNYYTYAGEIPWSNKFGYQLKNPQNKAKRQFARVFDEIKEIFKDNKHTMEIKFFDGNAVSFPIVTTKRIPGIKVEIPVWDFNWESYHSQINSFRQFKLPAPSLCEKLGLESHMHSVELFDRHGKQATIFRSDTYTIGVKKFELLYLREDLFKKYLEYTNQSMIWTIWGERGCHYDKLANLRNEVDFQKLKEDRRDRYKKLITLDDLES